MTGLPASSFAGDMLVAQRIDAMLIKIPLFARCRPGQILCWPSVGSIQKCMTQLPWSKSLRHEFRHQQKDTVGNVGNNLRIQRVLVKLTIPI